MSSHCHRYIFHPVITMNDPRRFRIFLMMVCIAFLLPLVVAVADAASSGGLTPGSGFTVSITGNPGTPYYVWLTRTSTMSGAPGDQPPVISGGISDVEKDPPDGPYLIGMHTISKGGTIIDDVAPSPDGLPGTNYYALVTTNADGVAIVQFRITPGTAVRTYSVKVEDRTGAAGNFNVQANLFPRTTLPTPVIVTIPPTSLPVTTIPTPEPTASVVVPAEPVAPPSTLPGPAASPSRYAPIPSWIVWSAVAAVFMLGAKR
jgi:hypothetical protein